VSSSATLGPRPVYMYHMTFRPKRERWGPPGTWCSNASTWSTRLWITHVDALLPTWAWEARSNKAARSRKSSQGGRAWWPYRHDIARGITH